jgi:ketose-bisphosphate aldolase
MALINTVEMLRSARDHGYCVGAFNVVDYLSIEAVVKAAENRRSPAIIQASSGTIKRFGVKALVTMARTAAAESKVPLALHLDHGTDCKILSEAIDAGFNSVMIDASAHPFEENISITAAVVKEAHARGVSVEGEIGVVAGVEDDIVAAHDASLYTTPEQAIEFKERTGIDFLAAAIGTAHGFYKVEPKLNIETLQQIHDRTDYLLVVHGGTGLSDEVVRNLVKAGANKFNVSTMIKQVYTDALYDYIGGHREEYNIMKTLDHARKEITAMLENYMVLLGSADKA